MIQVRNKNASGWEFKLFYKLLNPGCILRFNNTMNYPGIEQNRLFSCVRYICSLINFRYLQCIINWIYYHNWQMLYLVFLNLFHIQILNLWVLSNFPSIWQCLHNSIAQNIYDSRKLENIQYQVKEVHHLWTWNILMLPANSPIT